MPPSPDKPLVTVKWNDAHGAGRPTDYYNADEIPHRPMVMDTVGWLLRDDDTGVSVACEYCAEDKTWRGVAFIPRGMVVSVTPVKRPRRKPTHVDAA